MTASSPIQHNAVNIHANTENMGTYIKGTTTMHMTKSVTIVAVKAILPTFIERVNVCYNK